jgi:hypothetical protein
VELDRLFLVAATPAVTFSADPGADVVTGLYPQ